MVKVAVMARRGSTWWRKVVMGLVMLGLAAVLTGALGALVLESLVHKQWPTTAQVTQLFGVFLTVVATAVVPLLAWERRSRAVVAPTTAGVAQAKDVLAGLVGQQ